MSILYQYGTIDPIHGWSHARRHRVFRFIEVHADETMGFYRQGEWLRMNSWHPNNFRKYSRRNPKPETRA